MATNNIRQNITVTAQDQTTRGFRSVEKKLTRLDRFFSRIQTTLLGFVGLNIATNLVRDFTAISDVAVDLNAKMALVTTSVEDQTRAQAELVDISLRTGSSLEANTTLFTRMARPVRSLGFALEDTLKVTKLITQGLRISGASQQESASVIRQLSQAFASGVLRGEEFNALMENGGRVAIALSDGLGVTIGELRTMSKAGELSSKRVITALNKQADAIDRENARLPLTISRAFENIKTQFLAFQTQNLDFNASIADTINGIANNMDTVLKVALSGLKVALVTLTVLSAKRLKQKADNILASRAQAALEKKIAEDKARALIAEEVAESKLAASKSAQAAAEAASERALLQAKSAAIRIDIQALEISVQRRAAKRLENIENLKSITDSTLRQQAILKIKAAYTAEQQAVIALTLAKGKLHTTQVALAAATKAETVALFQNTTAQRANELATNKLSASKAVATTRFSKFFGAIGLANKGTGSFVAGLGRAAGALKPVIGFISRLASGLLGLPGLIGFIGFEIASSFIDMGVAWKGLLVGLKKIGSYLKFVLKLLSTPFSMSQHIADLRNELADIDTEFQQWSDNRIANEAAVAEGFVDARQKEEAARQEAKRKEIEAYAAIDKAEKESFDLRKENRKQMLKFQETVALNEDALLKSRIDSLKANSEQEKLELSSQLTNREEYERRAGEIDDRVKTATIQATIESTKTKLAQWSDYYAERIKAIGLSSKEQAQVRIDELTKSKELYGDLLSGLRKHHESLVIQHETYKNSVARIQGEIDDLQKASTDLETELIDDTLASYEKSFNEQQKIADIDAKLRKASHLDKVKDAAEIERIQTEAISELEAIAKAEAARAKTFKKGSLDELEARNNSNSAFQSYKDVVNDVVERKKALKVTTEDNASAAEAEAERTNQAIQTTLDKIAEIDKQLKLRRQILIDIDASQVFKELTKIEDRINEIKAGANIPVTVTRNEVDAKKDGGPIVKRADGGYIPRRDKVPGSGPGDKIKALLEPGEWIIRKSAVDKLGEGFMHQVNAGIAEPIRRKSGGFVGRNRSDSKTSSRTYRSMINSYTDDRNQLERLSKSGLSGYSNYLKGEVFGQLIRLTKTLKDKSPEIINRASYVGDDIAGLLNGKEKADTFDIVRQLMDRMRKIGEGETEFEPITGFKSKFDTRLLTLGRRDERTRDERQANKNDRRSARGDAREKARIADLERGLGGSYAQIDAALREKAKREGRKFSDGGRVPGKGNKDTEPALLTPGEFVIKKDAVQKFGTRFMNALNNMQLPDVSRFATGGLVGSSNIDIVKQLPSAYQSKESIDVTLNVGGKSAKGTFEDNDSTRDLLRVLRDSGEATA